MVHSFLVLDQNLMFLTSAGLGYQLYPHLMCCVWMRRSWTLQKGMLAQYYMFQFKDRMLVLKPKYAWSSSIKENWLDIVGEVSSPTPAPAHLISSVTNESSHITGELKRLLSDELLRFANDQSAPTNFQIDSNLSGKSFVSLWNALAGRSTTMSDDLYLICANVFGMMTEPLSQLSTSADKLKHIIFSFHSLPLWLLFTAKRNSGEDMVCANGWVPSEFSRELLEENPSMCSTFEKNRNFLKLVDSYNGPGDFDTYTIDSSVLASARSILEIEEFISGHVIERLFDANPNSVIPARQVIIMIMKNKFGSGMYRCGACLFITDDYRGCGRVLRCEFCFSIRVHHSSQKAEFESLPTFEAAEVERSTGMRLEYDVLSLRQYP